MEFVIIGLVVAAFVLVGYVLHRAEQRAKTLPIGRSDDKGPGRTQEK